MIEATHTIHLSNRQGALMFSATRQFVQLPRTGEYVELEQQIEDDNRPRRALRVDSIVWEFAASGSGVLIPRLHSVTTMSATAFEGTDYKPSEEADVRTEG